MGYIYEYHANSDIFNKMTPEKQTWWQCEIWDDDNTTTGFETLCPHVWTNIKSVGDNILHLCLLFSQHNNEARSLECPRILPCIHPIQLGSELKERTLNEGNVISTSEVSNTVMSVILKAWSNIAARWVDLQKHAKHTVER